jgi:hypothetical protein
MTRCKGSGWLRADKVSGMAHLLASCFMLVKTDSSASK